VKEGWAKQKRAAIPGKVATEKSGR
jgi:hypothetical protein